MGDFYDRQQDAIRDAAMAEDAEQAEWLEKLENEERLQSFEKWYKETAMTSGGVEMPRSVMRVVPLEGLVKMKHFEVTSKSGPAEMLRPICPSHLQDSAWDGRPPVGSFDPMLRRLIRDGLVKKTVLRPDELEGENQVRVHKVKLTLKGLIYAFRHGAATMDDVRVWWDTDGVGPEKTSNRIVLSARSRQRAEKRMMLKVEERRREIALEERLGEDGKKETAKVVNALESELKKLEKVGKSIADQAQAAEDGVVRLTTPADQTLLDGYDKVMWRFVRKGAYGPEGRDNSVDSTNVGLVTKWIIDGQAAKCFAWLHPDQQKEVVHQVLDMGETSLPAAVKVMLTKTISEKRGVLYKNLVAYHKEIKGSGESAAQEVDELILRVTWAIVRKVMDYRMGDPRYAPPPPPRDTKVKEKAELELEKKGYEYILADKVVRTRRRKKNL